MPQEDLPDKVPVLIPGAVGPHRVVHPRADGGDGLQVPEPALVKQPPDLPVNGWEIGRERDGGEVDGDARGLGEQNGDPVVGTCKRARKEKRDPDFVYY